MLVVGNRDGSPIWQLYEEQIAQVVKALDPTAIVEHNVRVTGQLSEYRRQIDVLVTGTIAGRPIAIAIECKCLSEAVGLGLVEAFISKIVDIEVTEGILFSSSGFTGPATRRAAGARYPAVHLQHVPHEELFKRRERIMLVQGRQIRWHPALAFAADPQVYARYAEELEAVNSWLNALAGDPPVVPSRKRSVEIFGDEKRLDALVGTSLFADGRLSLELLRARVPTPWLHTQQVGTGGVLLIVENLGTFESLVRALRKDPGRIGLVGFGAGAILPASICSIDGSRVTEIQYFGDLDPTGLRIPINADKVARERGLPAVRPAAGLYEALLQHGRPEPGQQPVPPKIARALAGWLVPAHRTAVENLLCSGYRLTQEAIEANYLDSCSAWRKS